MISRSSAAYCSCVCVCRRSMCLASNMTVGTVPYVLPMTQADPTDFVADNHQSTALGITSLSIRQQRLAAIGASVIYVAITAFLGRHVLAHLGTTIIHDAGDPLLTAALLKWNATHWPLTDAWWQLPF